MGRPKTVFVTHPNPNRSGLAIATLNADGFTYNVNAVVTSPTDGTVRLTFDAFLNEGGFRGRRWETSGAAYRGEPIGTIGEGQHQSLRSALQEGVEKAWDLWYTHKQAVELGLAPWGDES